MATLNYNCTALGDHERVSCGNYKVGGSSAVAIVEADYTVSDWTSASDWNTDITSGKIHLIEGIKAMLPEPSAVEGENPIGAGPETLLDSFNYEITWKDFNVTTSNNDFYNALNERRFYIVVLHDEDSEITVNTLYDCTAVVRSVTPEAVSEKRHYLVTVKFTGKDILPIYNAPTGVFNQD